MRPWFPAALAAVVLVLSAQDSRIENLAPFTPTPEVIVDRMLQLGRLQPGEVMFDLGSGDGRIVIMAAAKYKADSTGVEFDASLVKRSLDRIKKSNLSASAHIVHGDLLKQDYSRADLVTIYLLPVANEKLTPLLEKQLKKGTRIVSHNSAFPAWTPVKVEDVDDGEGRLHRLYLYQR